MNFLYFANVFAIFPPTGSPANPMNLNGTIFRPAKLRTYLGTLPNFNWLFVKL